MLDKIKKALRISNDFYNDEITDLINACKKDLELAGVASSRINDTDPIIIKTIKCYCKGNFGFDNNEAERFIQSYESLKSFLCLNYNTPAVVSTSSNGVEVTVEQSTSSDEEG